MLTSANSQKRAYLWQANIWVYEFMGRRLSHKATFASKFLVPFLWFFLSITFFAAIDNFPHWFLLLGWIICTIGILKILRIKEVHLDENTLVVSNFLQTMQVPLSNIKSVRQGRIDKRALVKVTFKEPTMFGSSIFFIPVVKYAGFLPFASHPHIDELIELVEN